MNDLLAKIMELGAAIGELKARAAVAEVKAEGAEERAKLLFEAKNLWQDRALAAEKKLAQANTTEPGVCPVHAAGNCLIDHKGEEKTL